jgi:serine/threonine protein kinase
MANRVGQQFGNYHLVKLLGEGGFAQVYLGEHVHLGTEAAVKVLSTKLTEEGVALFRKEARTIIDLEHPHIIRVLDFGMEERIPYIVMSYASKGTLRERHPKGSRLPLDTIVSYAKQVGDALQYAHDQRLIHRDVKPDNMLIARNNQVLLSDFGIAVVAHSTHSLNTLDGSGTLYYMAPEQIQGKPRIASDQYALGIVVYEWLSGTRPFNGTATEIGMQHLLASPPSLCEKLPALSPTIEEVVLRALAKDPKDRFSSVQDFTRVLERASHRTQHYSVISPRTIVAPKQPIEKISMAPSSPKLLSKSKNVLDVPVGSRTTQNNRTSIEPNYLQQFFGVLLLIMTLFLFAVLTVFRNISLFGPLGGAFIALFGWSAYLFSIGLIAFAIAHLIEGIHNKKLIRWPFVVGPVLLWLVLVAESQLLLKGRTGGILGALLIRPLLGWPEIAGHIILIGLFGVIIIVIFQITLRHMLALFRFIRKLFTFRPE